MRHCARQPGKHNAIGSHPWSTPMVCTHGLHPWSAPMVYTHGLHPWSAPMVYTHGLHPWSTPMVYTHGLHPWSAPMVCTHGLHPWSTGSSQTADIGIPIRSFLTTVYLATKKPSTVPWSRFGPGHGRTLLDLQV
jgi:hypothetical protein